MRTQPSTTATPTPLTDPIPIALLTFTVAGQTYSLPVTSVIRIIEMVTITHLPNAPGIIQGIINLQGKAVPVIDLRDCFGLDKPAYGLHTPIILIELDEQGRRLGLIVDTVEDVLHVPRTALELSETFVPSELAGQMAGQAGQMAGQAVHLAGVAKIGQQMILVLNERGLIALSDKSNWHLG